MIIGFGYPEIQYARGVQREMNKAVSIAWLLRKPQYKEGMNVLKDMLSIFTDRADFFWELLLEHLEIALVPILIAILFGGLVGILISEFQKPQGRR